MQGARKKRFFVVGRNEITGKVRAIRFEEGRLRFFEGERFQRASALSHFGPFPAGEARMARSEQADCIDGGVLAKF